MSDLVATTEKYVTVEDLIADALDCDLPDWVASIPYSAETKLAALLRMALELALKVKVPDNWGGEFDSRHHKDLAAMSDFELWRHQKRLELYLAVSEDPDTEHPWFEERMKAIVREQARRKQYR